MKNIFALLVLVLCYSYTSTAQDKKVRTKLELGEIIALKDNALFDDDYIQSQKKYQDNMLGVATGNNNPKKKSDIITKEGIAAIKIINENGSIKKGDFITSSSTPGIGMKATQSGMVIGVALEDAKGDSGLINARILIQYIKQ